MDRSFRATFGRAAGTFTQRDGNGGEADGEVGDGEVDDGKATGDSSDGCKVGDDEADDSGGDGSGDSIAVGTCWFALSPRPLNQAVWLAQSGPRMPTSPYVRR